jgi:DNA-directed RNA polymerase II subunit RPB1
MVQIMASDANDDRQVLRLRFRDLVDEETESAAAVIKDCESDLLNDLILKGIPDIIKVYAKKYTDTEFDPATGEKKTSEENWMLETDGVCLKRMLYEDTVDGTRTISNDLLEIKSVLGTEASRQALCNEFRTVLGFYGIYVNYRHISILCDMMA